MEKAISLIVSIIQIAENNLAKICLKLQDMPENDRKMNGRLVLMLFFILAAFVGCSPPSASFDSERPPVDHRGWDALLQKHVGPDGLVDYPGFINDSSALNAYLVLMKSTHPRSEWPTTEKMAYWINAYNAFTVELIVDHYPVKSIKDIKSGIPFVNSVWDIKFIEIEGIKYDLNNIEHRILRKQFDDPRIHAAINCASISCPPLLNEAYTAEKLEDQLETAMHRFLNDPLRNQITSGGARISKIFSWFGGDFKDHSGTIREYINQYADEPLSGEGKIEFLDYDWGLNERKMQ